jgi:hypothetical protein
LNDDGWLEVIVANDGEPNLVFQNKRNGTFAEIGATCGMAYDASGNVRRFRGVDAAWCGDDPSLSVAVAGAAGEGLRLYVSQGKKLQFADESQREGIAAVTRSHSSYGALFLDYDLDGWPDLLTANGDPDSPQSLQLLWNGGPKVEMVFQSVDQQPSGNDLFQLLAGRGLAYADIDGDNDLDILVSQHRGPPVLLRNDQATGHRSLRLKLIGSRGARDAIGARVTVHGAKRVWRSQVMPSRGFLSQSELPLTFGCGLGEKPRSMEVRWPSGFVQKLRVRRGERTMTVVEPLAKTVRQGSDY